MKITKMQGLGNDYIYIHCSEGMIPDPAALAEQVISSNFKVGLSQEEVDALLNGM